ncbi:type I-E CRISPR-associated protein Cse2/CasB [Entomohabitans teleogrylli]|uniref:type I-E CRISPR-associated protein Cse2/CasB n=1 Tax=Entomohabitans teleogrylli TaxID=1384589 RepID=UPI00073D31C9|nr:type I-E CRISPR-associated protein Cse2/CasB [Entomohabitans teleogrylli]
MSATTERRTRSGEFISYLFRLCNQDKGSAARLRRAANPATEYQSWEVLGSFGIRLDNDVERRVHALIAAGLANSRAEKNGTLTLGRAIALSFPEGNASDQARARLRRLLACDSAQEACLILRPLLTLVQSRVPSALDYERLLNDLLWFSDKTKARWAQQFYTREAREENGL